MFLEVQDHEMSLFFQSTRSTFSARASKTHDGKYRLHVAPDSRLKYNRAFDRAAITKFVTLIEAYATGNSEFPAVALDRIHHGV